MALPLCVKIDTDDAAFKAQFKALESEGWRFIGQLDIYKGEVFGSCEGVRISAEPPVCLASQISWSGRLWRDKEVLQGEAWSETESLFTKEDLICYVIGKAPAAFGLFDRERIVLIGVHPAARGLGLAKMLIKHVAHGGEIIAGTYADNEAAIALYKSVGMKRVKSQAVFHK